MSVSTARSAGAHASVRLGRKLAIIVGSIVGGVVLLSMAVCLIVCARRRTKSNAIELKFIVELTFASRSLSSTVKVSSINRTRV